MRGRFIRTLSLVAVIGAAAPAMPSAQTRATHDKAFWQAVAANKYAPPAGEPLEPLVREASALLASPDPELRDEIAYSALVSWIYRQKLVSVELRRALIDEWIGNLSFRIGSAGTDDVLRRSFSALSLGITAILDNETPYLEREQFDRMLQAALTYLAAEKDLRGFDAGKGWVHATAHTADLLKFLARDSRFTSDDQVRLLEAAWTRMAASSAPVFTHAEDERLAAALVSLVRRDDFDASRLDGWLQRFTTLEKQVWAKSPPDPQALDAAQNARNLLRSVYVQLSLPQPPPTAGQSAARDKLLATLQQIRR